MSRLMLLRHAKSSWDDRALKDFDRPLNARGRAAAPMMAAWMRTNGCVPDRVLCSTAQRTRETLAACVPLFASPLDVTLLDDLYEAEADEVAGLIRSRGGDSHGLLVIGHNPGIQECAADLVGAGDDRLVGSLESHYPTGALAVIDLDIDDWTALAPGSGTLVSFVRPRDLDGEPGGSADD